MTIDPEYMRLKYGWEPEQIQVLGPSAVVRPTGPGALTAARAPVQIVEGIPDADLLAYELRAEAAMVQALQQVMDTIADRIAKAGPQ